MTDESGMAVTTNREGQAMDEQIVGQEPSSTEEVEVAGSDLLACVKDLLKGDDVCRLILENPDGQPLLEVPLSTGLSVGGIATLLMPVGAALAALGAALTRVKVRVVRRQDVGQDSPEES